jgi:sucrose-6-phosphate hydrolase SacC (GH32 family)
MPDLFPLPVAGEPGRTQWVLIISVNHGSLSGGSGVQYFIGDFDGTRFTADARTWLPTAAGPAAAAPPLSRRMLVQRGARTRRFSGDGERHTAARLSPRRAEISLDLWVDQSTVELFADDGEVVISDLAFNDPDSHAIGLVTDDPACQVLRLVLTLLEPAG